MDGIDNTTSRMRITTAIATASARTGVDFTYLLNQARIESGLNPDARAKTSSATGLYQFTRQTWLATLKSSGADHGLGWAADAIGQDARGRYHVSDPQARTAILNLRFDPEASAAMAAEYAGDNAEFLTTQRGRALQSVDLYLAHFLGPAGASRFLKAYDADPGAAAAPLLPKAAAANRTIFYRSDGSARSVGEIRARFAAKMDDTGAPATSHAPIHQFASPRFAAAPVAPPREARLAPMVAMPSRLSLDFAQATYTRLSGLGA